MKDEKAKVTPTETSSELKLKDRETDDLPSSPNNSYSTADEGSFKYTKKEMLKICRSCVEKGMERPSYLDSRFLNDVGLWCPEAWLYSQWGKEMPRRKQIERVKNDASDDIVLSPQRRSFGAGCRRPASPRVNSASEQTSSANHVQTEEGAVFQKGSAQSGPQGNGSQVVKSWRNTERMASNSGQSIGTRGPDQRNFQENRGNNQQLSWRDREYRNDQRNNYGQQQREGNWRVRGNSSFMPNFRRNDNRRDGYRPHEDTPEWMDDGPESAYDTIELKGFDDDNTAKNDTNRYEEIMAGKKVTAPIGGKGMQPLEQQLEQGGRSSEGSSRSGSRPSSRRGRNIKGVGSTDERSSESPSLMKTGDMGDFLRMMGISPNTRNGFESFLPGFEGTTEFGADGGSVKQGGSRFSRFFNAEGDTKPSDTNNNENQQKEMSAIGGGDADRRGSDIIQKLMAFQKEAGSVAVKPELPETAKSLAEIEQGMMAKHHQQSVGNVPTGGRALRGQGHQQGTGDTRVLQELLNMGSGDGRPTGGSVPANAMTEHQLLATMAQQHGAPPIGEQGKIAAAMNAAGQSIKGNPLGDPRQQAKLMETLKFLQLQQGKDMGGATEQQIQQAIRNIRTPSPNLMQQGSGGQGPSGVPPAQGGINPAMLAQMAAMNGGRMPFPPGQGRGPSPQFGGPRGIPPLPPGVTPEMVAVQQMYMQWMMQQTHQKISPPQGQGRDHQEGRHSPSMKSGGGVSSAFMPTSVLKQMSKQQLRAEQDSLDTEPDIGASKDLSVAGHARNKMPSHDGGQGMTVQQQMQAAQQEQIMRAYQQQYMSMMAQQMGSMRGPYPPAGFPPAGAPPMMRRPGGPPGPDPMIMQNIMRAQMMQANMALQQQAVRQRMMLQQQMAMVQQQQRGRGPSPTNKAPHFDQMDPLAKLLAGGAGGLGLPGLPEGAKPLSLAEVERLEQAKAVAE